MITAVLFSRGRHHLLNETLGSFLATNPSPLKRMIVVEDGPDFPREFLRQFTGRQIEWISTGQRVGPIAAVDYAYSRVDTPYVFHLEDDWRFYRSGFLERSLVVLESNPKCLQVQIRAVDDLDGHPVDAHTSTDRGVPWRRLALDSSGESGDRHAFSFNPGLRRLSDYVSIGGYGVNTQFDTEAQRMPERAIGRLYRRRDFFAAVLADDNGSGYVQRLGGSREDLRMRDTNR